MAVRTEKLHGERVTLDGFDARGDDDLLMQPVELVFVEHRCCTSISLLDVDCCL